jgi:nucleotide sugar dehydrogenase
MDIQETKKKVNKKKCIVEIFGLGYVGFPLSIRLASSGFNVIGIDTNEERLKRLESNQLKQSETNLQEQFRDLRNNKKILFSKFSAKSNLPRIGIICVPTPIAQKQKNSNVFVNAAIEDFLSCAKKGDILFIESSLEIGTFEKIKCLIKKNGFSIEKDFGLAYCPERIDPLNKKWELHNIPRVIYCENDSTFEIAKSIYENINQANLVRVFSSKVAEVVKSFENTFRLVNISLVNELAILCDRLDINISEVLSAASTKPFGFIPFYSGAGAGGHCIPKDSIFLYNSAKKFDFDFSMVRKALEINELVPTYIVNSVEKILIEKNLPKKVLVIGLAYKADLEDMRDSPGLKIVSRLVNSSVKVDVFDPFFNTDSLKELSRNEKMNQNNFKVLENLDESDMKNISCIIIVQHHTKIKEIIQKIYDNSLVPVIYDCQCRLIPNVNSSTILKSFG